QRGCYSQPEAPTPNRRCHGDSYSGGPDAALAGKIGRLSRNVQSDGDPATAHFRAELPGAWKPGGRSSPVERKPGQHVLDLRQLGNPKRVSAGRSAKSVLYPGAG